MQKKRATLWLDSDV